MVYLKKALKVTLVSALLVVGSITSAQASHDDHSILPYVVLGVFAGALFNNSHHGHTHYRYKKKRHYSHSSHYGHGGHYSSGYQHSHSHGGYHYKKKRH